MHSLRRAQPKQKSAEVRERARRNRELLTHRGVAPERAASRLMNCRLSLFAISGAAVGREVVPLPSYHSCMNTRRTQSPRALLIFSPASKHSTFKSIQLSTKLSNIFVIENTYILRGANLGHL